MRSMVFAICATLLVAAAPAGAAENFIPKGHLYAPDSGGLPPLNSGSDDINNRTDAYEAEIYVFNREQKVFESQLNRFFEEQQPGGGDFSPDY